MGFRAGRVSFIRCQVHGPKPRAFSQEHVDRLAAHKAGRRRLASNDGVETGWTAGEHLLDIEFNLAKNILHGALLFDFRVDVDKPPPDLLHAYTALELKAKTRSKASGLITSRQKREAKELARQRLAEEAKDGRYTRRKCHPVMWDAELNELLFGSAAPVAFDQFSSLFHASFGQELEWISAGARAYRLAELHGLTRAVDDAAPSAFTADTPRQYAWSLNKSSRDFIGNELLLWLWFHTEVETDVIGLMDGSEASVMLARSLTLECPRGETGQETIRHELPQRLPEAKRALQGGKLPRKAGLTIIRQGQVVEFTLQAETLAVSGAKLPAIHDDIVEERARQEERITQIRELIETIDLLYDAFCRLRFGREWKTILSKMQQWLRL